MHPTNLDNRGIYCDIDANHDAFSCLDFPQYLPFSLCVNTQLKPPFLVLRFDLVRAFIKIKNQPNFILNCILVCAFWENRYNPTLAQKLQAPHCFQRMDGVNPE